MHASAEVRLVALTPSEELMSRRFDPPRPPRLLVLSFHAPPETAVGGLRWAGLCRHLVRRGWQARMITASPGGEDEGSAPAVQFLRIERRITLQDRYRAWRTGHGRADADGGARPAGPEGPGEGKRSSKRRGAVRQSLASLLDFPDPARGWILRAAGATRRTIREWRPDVVISTGPPHSVHLAARLGMGRSGVPWVIDLRDPWITPWDEDRKSGWAPSVRRWLEATLMRAADLVFTTTRELRGMVCSRFPEASLRWVPNGVDPELLPAWSWDPGSGLTLTHLGTVYFNRDPTPVLRAFAGFLGAHPDAQGKGSAVRFVGHVSPEFRPALDEAVASLGLASSVDLVGTVPRPDALGILARSSVALVLAQGQDGMVPAKLYEAVAMGIPTLVVAEPESSTGREAGRIGAIVHDPEDVSGMTETLGRIWSGEGGNTGGPPTRVSHAHLAQEVEGLLLPLCHARRASGEASS